MKNIKRVALYNPYLDTLGGGEKYTLLILKVFDDLGFKIDLFWKKNLKKQIKERFNLNFNYLQFSNIFFSQKSFIKKFLFLGNYDLFFYVTDGSYFFSSAKKNFIYAMIPNKNLYKLTPINRLKLINFSFFTHSLFNQKNLKKWGIESAVLYPYIDDIFFVDKNFKKEKIILSVGRFFPHLHSKNQQKIIEIFKKLQKTNKDFFSYKLILAGGLKKEDKDYFQFLKKSSQNNPQIIFKVNPSFKEIVKLYQSSSFFWHLTGFGEDENKNPEKVEHLGIAPLEAMATKNIVFCFKAGGPKEIINEKNNGFLFNNEDELIKKMILIYKNKSLINKIRENSQNYIKKFFSYKKFKEKVIEIFL